MNQDITRDAAWREELRKSKSVRERTSIPRVAMPQLPADFRVTCNEEVNRGLSREMAVLEASRCLDCPDPRCMTGCPVGIHIPAFIKHIERGDEAGAYRVLRMTSALPAVCGRVCPQEKQCESECVYHRMKKAPVAIGYLERYAADCAAASGENIGAGPESMPAGPKIAVAGSGPAGLSFAGEMASYGYRVTVFEALHKIGGVLIYGIPEFRLPNSVVEAEIEALRRRGVEFVTDCIIGKTLSHSQLREMGFEGIFVGSGAGLPRFMGIPGENYIGVMSSNEYLTRINLMGAGQPGEDTPVLKGRNVAVIGGGNTAMDSCRTARRQGAERVMIVYRRGEAEMPARIEEVEHAKEEGVEFMTLCNPVEYIADENGRVCRMRVQRMELGEPDASGRRSPIPVEGAIEEIPADMVIVSVGVSPNPIIPNAFTDLEVSRRGTIEVDAETMRSSMDDLWAGGDIVRGGATVILAMGDGRRAAVAMHAALSARQNRI